MPRIHWTHHKREQFTIAHRRAQEQGRPRFVFEDDEHGPLYVETWMGGAIRSALSRLDVVKGDVFFWLVAVPVTPREVAVTNQKEMNL